MADTFAYYDHLPQPLQSALREIEQLIYEVDGKTLATPDSDGCFINNGVVVAGDLADSFNVIVAALSVAGDALENLTKDPPPTLDEPDTDAEVIVKMRAIARGALEGTAGGHRDG